MAIPDKDVTVNLGAGNAEMKVDNLALGDYFNKGLAFGVNWQTADVDATVSFDVVWSGPVTRRLNFQDATNSDHFGGEYAENQVSVTWSGSNVNGFSFTANPGSFSTSFNAFAELAHEQNGIFFDAGADAALAHALVAPTAAPATTNPSLVPAPQWAETLTATPIGDAQPRQSTSGPNPLTAVGTHLEALDQLFADLSGSQLAQTSGEEVHAGAV
jgi:hypothetical protein